MKYSCITLRNAQDIINNLKELQENVNFVFVLPTQSYKQSLKHKWRHAYTIYCNQQKANICFEDYIENNLYEYLAHVDNCEWEFDDDLRKTGFANIFYTDSLYLNTYLASWNLNPNNKYVFDIIEVDRFREGELLCKCLNLIASTDEI